MTREASSPREAVIVASVRTAVGKAPKGTLRETRPDDMAAAAIRAAMERVPALKPEQVEDVVLGCAMPEAEQGMNVARQAALLAGIPCTAAAVTVNRFCASGLQAIAFAARAIEAGEADVIVAGGTESMSLIPMGGHKISPSPTLVDTHPDVYLGMGAWPNMSSTSGAEKQPWRSWQESPLHAKKPSGWAWNRWLQADILPSNLRMERFFYPPAKAKPINIYRRNCSLPCAGIWKSSRKYRAYFRRASLESLFNQ